MYEHVHSAAGVRQTSKQIHYLLTNSQILKIPIILTNKGGPDLNETAGVNSRLRRHKHEHYLRGSITISRSPSQVTCIGVFSPSHVIKNFATYAIIIPRATNQNSTVARDNCVTIANTRLDLLEPSPSGCDVDWRENAGARG